MPSQTRSFQALVSVVEDSRLAQSQQSELVRREKEATQAVKKLEADLFAERADHSRQVLHLHMYMLLSIVATQILRWHSRIPILRLQNAQELQTLQLRMSMDIISISLCERARPVWYGACRMLSIMFAGTCILRGTPKNRKKNGVHEILTFRLDVLARRSIQDGN